MVRPSTVRSAANLARLGFTDTERALAALADLGAEVDALVPYFGTVADPDLAVSSLLRLFESLESGGPELVAALIEDEGTAMRLLSVLGASDALGDHLVRHPDHWQELTDPSLGSTRPSAGSIRACLLGAIGADPEAEHPVASDVVEATNALRVEYRRHLLRLASRDLAHHLPVADVAAELSDLAAGTLDAGLAIARAEVTDFDRCRIAVIAMGKCGGHELNYVSDVDVIFVAEPAVADDDGALTVGNMLAAAMMRACSADTVEGTIWPVDAALRPEGKAGPLVRTVASHRGYYEQWASTWEFQALLKARAVAGDLELGERYEETVTPFVWDAASREGFVADTQAMRLRVLDNIPAREADRQLKLGSGGLRDVEFAVQLLQLVHGRADERIRAADTLTALSQLTKAGYVGREDGEALGQTYEFLRKMEHRIQLYGLRRTHVVPDDESDLRRLGRSMGYLKDPVNAVEAAWREHRKVARRLHEKLFYRPLLSAVAGMSTAEVALSPDAARQRMAALGFDDPEAAFRHLEALTAGSSRTAAIQRTLLPAMLAWFADAPDPDAGLFGFRRISDTLGRTPWYLKLLRDEGEIAQRLAQVLGTSRYATSLLEREPEGMKVLAELKISSREAIQAEMTSVAARRSDPEEAVRSIRAIRRRELLRLAGADVVESLSPETVGYALTDLTTATIEAALQVVSPADLPTRVAVIAMGRYGGAELGYGSDADVMFVHDPLPGADAEDASRAARTVIEDLRRLLGSSASDPPVELDADLRPEGRQGPLVRTLESYAGYYDRWSEVWEAQALLRAHPVAGDPELQQKFAAMIDPLRYPAAGLTERDIVEIRRIKARVDDERLPKGADPRRHLKLGPGGLADIEWTVQLLQLRWAGEVESLRTTRTLDAIDAAVAADLVEPADAAILTEAWRFASRIRNAAMLVRGRPLDQLPSDPRELAAVARMLGYGPEESTEMLNEYQRAARRASDAVQRIFWT